MILEGDTKGVPRGQAVGCFATDAYSSVGWALKRGNQPQQRTLSTTARTQQCDEFRLLDRDGDIFQGQHALALPLERKSLGDMLNPDCGAVHTFLIGPFSSGAMVQAATL